MDSLEPFQLCTARFCHLFSEEGLLPPVLAVKFSKLTHAHTALRFEGATSVKTSVVSRRGRVRDRSHITQLTYRRLEALT